MKIHSISLRNYRGIVERKVELELTGVTVIEGPNEIGKSSLGEALNLIFEHPDSTKNKEVRGVQPVDRDVGPEIEVEVEIGPYQLVYSKRFLKKQETLLKITAPKPENVTGREAHDRVQALLAEFVDAELWRALRVMQDSRIERVDLTNAASLAEALDQVAGGEIAGDRERSIFDAIHAEFNLYYTDNVSARKPLTEAADEVSAGERAVAELERELQAVDRLIQDSSRLTSEIADLDEQLGAAKKALATRQDEERDLNQQEERLLHLALAKSQAAEVEQRADKEVKTRRELAVKLQRAETDGTNLVAEQAKDALGIGVAESAENQVRRDLDAARGEATEVAQLAALRAADVEYHSNKLDLELLDERRQLVEDWQAKKEEAVELLSKCRLDDQLLERLRKAQGEMIRTQAQLAAGSPRLRITALGNISLEIAAESRALQLGASFEETVREKTRLVIASLAEIEVTAGTSLDELIRSQELSQKKLTELLRLGCVSDLDAAEKASLAYRDAKYCIASADKTIKTALRDLTFEQMLSKIARLAASVEAYPATRVVEPAMLDSLDAAKAGRNVAQARNDEADRKLRATQAKHEAALRLLGDLQLNAARVGGQLVAVEHQLQAFQQELSIARSHKSDAELEQELSLATSQAVAAKDAWQAARLALELKDPQRTRELASNAGKAVQRMTLELRTKEDEQNATLAKLDLLGARGIFESLEEARMGLARVAQRKKTLQQRAAAAHLLYSTMKRKRDEARRAYAAPLRDKIVQLGRYLFDSSFGVELDDKLAIINRSLGGLTLPFDSLSIGAKEQLGLIVRLACSLLVDQEQGVPLIFDDTLGHSDPERLEGMGAMLSHAAERCQIIILTCTPGRFRHIGDAKTIRLRAAVD